MKESGKKTQGKQEITEYKTFPVPFSLAEVKKSIFITTQTPKEASKEEIINQAFKLHSQGNILEAAKY